MIADLLVVCGFAFFFVCLLWLSDKVAGWVVDDE